MKEDSDSLSYDEELTALRREIHKIHGRVYYLSVSVYILAIMILLLIFQVYWGIGFLGLAGTVAIFLPFFVCGFYIVAEMRKEAKKLL